MVVAARAFVETARALGIGPAKSMRYIETAFSRR
jgi:hypothetical protein